MELSKVYRYYGYDIVSNEKIFHQYATMEYINSTGMTFPVMDSVKEVFCSQIDSEGRYSSLGS